MSKESKKMLKGVIPKKQQVYNKFLFDEHCDCLRTIEVIEKDLNSLKVTDKANRAGFASLFPRVEHLESENEAALKAHGTRGLEITLILKRLEALEKEMKGLLPGEPGNLYYRVVELERNKADAVSLSGKGGDEIRDMLRVFEAKMKEQRGDYHDHIAQLVRENEAAHELIRKNASVAQECGNAQAHEILKMQEQIKGLENRLSRAQDMIAECHPDGCIMPAKKRPGRPKKGG